MSGWSKKELERLIAGDISIKKLSKNTQKELASAFEKSWIMEAWTPTEMTAEEYQALLKKYSNSDLPALEFKEWIDDAGKNILAGDSEKIIATPEWVNFREWQVAELPTQNVNYLDTNIWQKWIDKWVKEIWESDFGKMYKGIKWADAENFLIEQWQWEVKWAYKYKNKPIDLVRWEYDPVTQNWYWLSKISQKHPEILWKIQNLLDTLPEISRSENRIRLWDENNIVVISRDFKWNKKRWVLTAYHID